MTRKSPKSFAISLPRWAPDTQSVVLLWWCRWGFIFLSIPLIAGATLFLEICYLLGKLMVSVPEIANLVATLFSPIITLLVSPVNTLLVSPVGTVAASMGNTIQLIEFQKLTWFFWGHQASTATLCVTLLGMNVVVLAYFIYGGIYRFFEWRRFR